MSRTDKSISITNLYKSISKVSTEAVINQLQLKNPALRTYLEDKFKNNNVNSDVFLADPLIEATFGWKSASKDESMSRLVEQGILNKILVDYMDRAPGPLHLESQDKKAGKQRLEYSDDIEEDYTWPIDRSPYVHQLIAWKTLTSERVKSAVITSGTGSGKTECFLVPLLNSLAEQAQNVESDLEGVQAIMLYPLNALINSQRERLSAWTRGFSGKIKYALYNSDTEESGSKAVQSHLNGTPERMLYRKDIRKSPPSILVTNATMLEYMLVRPIDRGIIDNSKGKLRWIILDEAHTLIGSQAAEIALLLRRTMLAFEVKPSDVRFVATSATIGDSSDWEKTKARLQNFIADIANISPEDVVVVPGERKVPELPEYEFEATPKSLDELEMMPSAKAYEHLCQTISMRIVRDHLKSSPLTISEISEILFPNDKPNDPQNRLATSRLIDIATNAYPDQQSEPFFPIRLHLFHRSQRGLWTCVNPDCSEKSSVLKSGWLFGEVFTEEREKCNCGYPVFELTHCKECNEPSLSATLYSGEKGEKKLVPRKQLNIDEFADDIDRDDEELELHTLLEKDGNVQIFSYSSDINIRYKGLGGAILASLEKNSSLHPEKSSGIDIFYTSGDRDSNLRCACCDTPEKNEGQVFRRALMGAPFLMGNIVPELLKHIPRKDKSNLRGSRLITFTDSRQGTARFSAKLQLDAERKWCRSQVYRALLIKRNRSSVEDLPQIKTLKEILDKTDSPEVKSLIQKQIEKEKSNLSDSNNSSISWLEMIELLAETDTINLLSGNVDETLDNALPGEYALREEQLSNSQKLARLFLFREFARRPLRANNLESMGLVKLTYPKLKNIQDEDLNSKCKEWKELNLTIDDWRVFLKLILDFYVRDDTIIEIKPFEINWMGARLYPRLLRGQEFKAKEYIEKVALRSFPAVREKGRNHKLVRLLEFITQRSVEQYPELINHILSSAWEMLVKFELLSHYEDQNEPLRSGYHLKFQETVALELIESASVCPKTNRWLDTTLRGVTPIVTGKSSENDVRIESHEVKIPHPPSSLLNSDRKDELEEWLHEEPIIIEFRNKGLWRDLNDSAISGGQLLRSAEHSAQQDAGLLKRMEKAFKRDYLNVLNCSTTMEMGVDIGSLTMVAMNNAPPSTSNYLQRAGRAGRRGESTSVVLTFCKSTPHGERIFANPKWPFETPIPVPSVALESSQIVRRHLNAYLLAKFLRTKLIEENLTALKAGRFFISEFENSYFDLFISWCENEASRDNSINQELKILTRGTALNEMIQDALISICTETMIQTGEHWISRYSALHDEIKNSDKDSARVRLQYQLQNMEDDFLLKVLSARGFLPGYGFPTNVVELITNNEVDKKSPNKKKNYPSRSLETAIREYQPGKDIVLNGAVYRSQGLQLSWKVPNSEHEIAKIQQIRYIIHCSDCGSHESDISHNQYGRNCLDCGSLNIRAMEYIVPMGFQVDYRAPLHNDYTAPAYSEYVEPLLSVNDATWQALQKIDLGRFRISDVGNIFYYNDGQGAGFAMCWNCGRMEVLETNSSRNRYELNSRPKLLEKQHERLRGTSKSGERRCEKTDWSIKVGALSDDDIVKTPFVMGFDMTTSMLELQLRDPENHKWLSDETIAYSLAASLRQVFCSTEGISDNELGIQTIIKSTVEKQRVVSLFIYDKAEQGAGYSTKLAEQLPTLISDVYQFVKECPSKCDSACHSCLLNYDTQHNADKLNRHVLIEFIERTRLNEQLLLPEARRYFGNNSKPELTDGSRLLSIKGRNAASIDVFIHSDEWSITDNTVLKQLKNLTKCPVRLMINSEVLSQLSPDMAWTLGRELDNEISVHRYEKIDAFGRDAFPLLRMKFIDGDYWYVTDDLNSVSLNSNWGDTSTRCLVASKGISYNFNSSEFDIESLARSSSLQNNIGLLNDIGTKLDTHVQGFGSGLLEMLLAESSIEDDLRTGITRIIYKDRYLVTPLSAFLISNFIYTLKKEFGLFISMIETATPVYQNRSSRCIADNFSSRNEIIDYFEGLSEVWEQEFGLNLREKQDLDHGRYLNIELTSGKTIQILFDQGMGFWCHRWPYSRIKFDFTSTKDEGLASKSLDFKIKASSGNSYIVIHEL